MKVYQRKKKGKCYPASLLQHIEQPIHQLIEFTDIIQLIQGIIFQLYQKEEIQSLKYWFELLIHPKIFF